MQSLCVPMEDTDGHVNGHKVSSPKITKTLSIVSHVSDSEDRDHDKESSVSDCESVVSGPTTEQRTSLFGRGLVEIDEGDRLHEIIKQKFVLGLGFLGMESSVVAIHRNNCSGFLGQARLQSFRVFARAMEKKCGGNGNLKYAWFGGSKDEIERIVSHGFGHCENRKGLFGCGMYLSPDDSSVDSVRSSIPDDNGLGHVILCRVILGNMELVHPGSEQFHPSSGQFDSGVDDLMAPKRYIVWSAQTNTHILPEYVISFRVPCLNGLQRVRDPVRKPSSPWMPFSTLIPVLSKFLPPDSISLIYKHHAHYRENKISRPELVRRLRQIAGDKLLTAVIKSFRDKQFKASTDYSPNTSNAFTRKTGRNSEQR